MDTLEDVGTKYAPVPASTAGCTRGLSCIIGRSPGERSAAGWRTTARLAAATLIGGLVLIISACSGGGGGGDSNGPPAPVSNVVPTAAFTVAPSTGVAPLTVQLDASGSTDSDGSIASYSWNFGDNTPAASGATATHTFQASGAYTVALTVTDNSGASGSTTRVVSVGQATKTAKITSIDNGDLTVCAVGEDGSAWCWGPNDYGQLGNGDTETGYVPGAAAAGYGFSKVVVSNGGAFTCGITTEGLGYCWGNQEGGRLGDGIVAPVGQFTKTPVAVAGGHTFSDIAAGGDHVCAVATGGAVYCWGHNRYGQLGTGDNSDSPRPVLVTGGLTFKSVTAHQMVTCGITVAGDGYCWGNGAAGNLGRGSNSSANAPAPITGGLKFSSLSLGVWTACGITTEGDAYCWGSNGNGELGIGSKTPSVAFEPMAVAGGHKWKSIGAGVAVTCGVTTLGRGYCWGGNAFGERGDGPFPAADVTSPVPVVGDLVFDAIDADWVSCGVASGAAYCWGLGTKGSIGDGAAVNRGVPTKAAGQ